MTDFSRVRGAKQVVYFIQGIGGGPIKIGTSKDPRKRLAALQSGSPVALRLLAAIEGDERLEADLHVAFDDDRLHGEWFNNSENLVAFLGRILAESKAYRDDADAIEEITALAAEDDDANYLAVEAETARYVRYRLAKERMHEAQAETIAWLNEVWKEHATELDWYPANHIWKAMLKKYPPEVVEEAVEITAPKCNAGFVRKNGYHKYMFGVMRRLVEPEDEA